MQRAQQQRAAALAALAALLLVGSFQLAAASRDLLQTSGTCIAQIPNCETGRCSTATVAGALSSVCARCKSGFIASDSGLNCICRAGTYFNAGACVECGEGFFCPGGSKVAKNLAPATQYGQRFSCEWAVVDAALTSAIIRDKGLTTKSKRARTHTDCVPMPGYFLKVATRANQVAETCGPNTYSPGYTRLRSCLKCQSGLVESSAPANTLRTDKVAVCGVPGGRYLSQNVVRFCPLGTWRTDWLVSTDAAARFCNPCPKGITTASTGALVPTACNVALPGYQVDSSWINGAGAQTDGNGLPTAEPPKCPIGTYFGGGVVPSTSGFTCQPCPFGTKTQDEGATSIDDCMVPPGYFLQVVGGTKAAPSATSVIAKCPVSVPAASIPAALQTAGSTLPQAQGTYRADWKSWKDESVRSDLTGAGAGADACMLCGDGILSALTDINEVAATPTDPPTDLVATSSASCYIEPGWGMTPVPMAINKWQAALCTRNSYGVEARTFGLQQSPCKPCQRNMVTTSDGANSFTACTNPDGYGVSTDGVAQCPKGTWVAAGTMLPCTPCAPGRTTADQPAAPAPFDPELQKDPTDCIVAPGSGVVGTVTINDAANVLLSVTQCPVGTFSSTVTTVATTCTLCDTGFSTIDQGTIGTANADACTKCAAGYGRTNPAVTTLSCGDCTYGTFQTGYNGVVGLNRPGDGEICLGCSRSNFTYVGSRGRKARYESEGITLYTKSRGPEACVPRMQQLLIDAGQSFSLPDSLYTTVSAVTADACIAAGRAASDGATGKAAFVAFTYDATATTEALLSTCKVASVNLAPATQVADVLLVKLIPSDPIAAASVSAKSMASGLYARLNPGSSNLLSTIGQAITGATGLALDERLCKRRCDMNSLCWGVRITTVGSCTLVTGEDALDVRSFYFNPKPDFTASTATSLESFKW